MPKMVPVTHKSFPQVFHSVGHLQVGTLACSFDHQRVMPITKRIDRATTALTRFRATTDRKTYAALSTLSDVPASTLWHREHGRRSRKEKAASQQYFTPSEEKALADFLLRMYNNDFPLRVKYLPYLAQVVNRQRSSNFQAPAADETIRPPGKNWAQAFCRRHPEIKTRRVKAMDWNRYDKNIYDKVIDWFALIGKELADPAILPKNVYNYDETGVLLSSLGSLKVLVGKDDLRNCRGVGVKRTLVTAIECISADGRCLSPLIVWPAVTHRSTWTTHPTPGWHFACSKTGYTDSEISLYWIQHVFDPLTKSRANGKPRILISDGFAVHESLEILRFCFENNIILRRLPSHTSHKLQPCDVALFGPLKVAYREQVEQLYRGGANTIGKEHFTFLYRRARSIAFTRCLSAPSPWHVTWPIYGLAAPIQYYLCATPPSLVTTSSLAGPRRASTRLTQTGFLRTSESHKRRRTLIKMISKCNHLPRKNSCEHPLHPRPLHYYVVKPKKISSYLIVDGGYTGLNHVCG
jgi:hypothetical protein